MRRLVLGKRVAVWGAAFKPNSDDIRDSPALNVAASIHLQGAQVTVYDPKAKDNARKMFPTLAYADSAMEAAHRADVILHLTEWQEFRELDPVAVGGQVAGHPHRRRPQRAGRGRLARRRLDVPGARPALKPAPGRETGLNHP